MGQRGAVRGEALAERAGGEMDVARQLARLKHIGVVAGDEVDRRPLRAGAHRGQEGVAGFECGGERHHRACRQRHADIAADRSGVPDLERGKKGAGAELKQGRRGPFRRRLETIQLGDGAGRGNVETGVGSGKQGQRSERRSMRVSVAICGVENSQVPPASQA